ncbi:hypothetical protein M514_03493 [Trichuris suis]|uniref:Nucleoside phosphorylase domain-containing protein n=1 Tax=Trichuris suis TaxID=68888 RepID=A0A085NDM0_9BILA|nr:hypothetical protein M514_03493 [Trichuris suis]
MQVPSYQTCTHAVLRLLATKPVILFCSYLSLATIWHFNDLGKWLEASKAFRSALYKRMANGAKRKQIQPIYDDVIDASDFRELCHLGIRADDADVEKEFSSVQFVFFCKSANSALRMAEHIGARLPNALPYGMEPINLSNNNTYAVYKVGPVLCVSHGLGEAPCLITLHELTKLLRSASNVFPYYFLVGKCTGLGAEPGTIILTTASVNGILKPYFETFRLGKKVKYASVTDQHMVALAAEVCNELKVKHVKGLTLGTNDYYEGEGRRSETLCCGTSETKKSFFERAQVLGVRNFRMESTCFAAFCNRAQIKAAVISVVCLNRLHSEDAVMSECSNMKNEQLLFDVATALVEKLLPSP